MATPTIIIGLGTSGLYVLENVQKYYYENFKVNKPSNVEYLYLETNESNYPSGTPAGNDIQRVYISLDNMADMIKGVKNRCDSPEWLPETGTVLTAGLGAGGIRSCGRLALWGTNDKGDNFQNVINKIDSAYRKVSPTSGTGEKPTVFVTGSLTGGTCSGVFIDFGYLIRHVIDNIKDLYGLFLIPNALVSSLRGSEVMNGNTYGAIYDLDYYNKVETRYVEKWPILTEKKNYEMPPYELVQFISQDYKDGSPAISNLGGLYKMAGLYLFLNIAGIYNKRRERLVDAFGNSQIGKYGTFGLSAIQFPKDSIQDYVASSLSINLLKRLTDAKEFYKNDDQKTPINRGNIKNLIPQKMDDILANAFSNLNTGGKDLLIEMKEEVGKLKNEKDKLQYIISLFSSDYNYKFYHKVKGNMLTAQKIVVDGIYEMVDKALQNSENLYYAKFVLEDIVEYIDKLMDYWKSLDLSSLSNNWDDKLRKEAEKCTKNTYRMIGEEENVTFDRFQNILELMKMHLSIGMLINIKNHIREGKIIVEGYENELPKVPFFNTLIEKVLQVIGTIENDDSEVNRYNFERRKAIIVGEVNDKTLPILRVYPSGEFNEECKKGQQTYESRNGQVRSLKGLKNIEDFNLLHYFKEKSAGKFNQELYTDLLKDFRKKIDASNCVEDYDILTFINSKSDNKNACINTANKSNYPFIKLNRPLSSSNELPHFIVCNDTHKISTIIQNFGSSTEFKFSDHPNEKLELTELKNIVVFYNEKGNYIPIDDISYISQMKVAYEKRPDDLADKNVTNDSWNRMRRAYIMQNTNFQTSTSIPNVN